tara:strand:+ start:831 stop:1100 length:270 start_codon:yes stop_codon:yes gene_type:complete
MTWKDEIKKSDVLKRKANMTVGDLLEKLNGVDKSTPIYVDEGKMDKTAVDIMYVNEAFILDEMSNRVAYGEGERQGVSKLDKCIIIKPA